MQQNTCGNTSVFCGERGDNWLSAGLAGCIGSSPPCSDPYGLDWPIIYNAGSYWVFIKLTHRLITGQKYRR